MRVIVICEFSGRVREAFAALGHDAWSCDLLPTEIPSEKHYQCKIEDIDPEIIKSFDLAICHPPCTHLAASGARWFKFKEKEQAEALDFVRYLFNLPIHKIALENPVGVIGTKIKPCTQVIHPWQYGHGEIKKTCLWLKNLPRLRPSNIVEGRMDRIYQLPQSADRWKERSRTYPGIAKAMAEQWGGKC